MRCPRLSLVLQFLQALEVVHLEHGCLLPVLGQRVLVQEGAARRVELRAGRKGSGLFRIFSRTEVRPCRKV